MYVNWPICGSSLTVLENPQLPQGMQIQGMSGLGCGCRGCRGGLGYFSTGLDISGWGAAEWLTVIGGFVLLWAGLPAPPTKRWMGRMSREYPRHPRTLG